MDNNEIDKIHNINIEPEVKTNIEFQKHITEENIFKLVFYVGLSGWTKITLKSEVETLSGKKIEYSDEWVKEDKNRLMNEACADFLFSSMTPLISKLSTTSISNAEEIFDAYSGVIDGIGDALIENYYFENNSYDLKIDRLHQIISFLCSFQIITRKSMQGFTLKEIAETLISQTISRNEPPQQSKGMLENVFKTFNGK